MWLRFVVGFVSAGLEIAKCLRSVDVIRFCIFVFFFLRIRPPPRSTQDRSSAASDVYKRQLYAGVTAYLVKRVSDHKGKRCHGFTQQYGCLLYTSPSPRERNRSRMPSSALKKKTQNIK